MNLPFPAVRASSTRRLPTFRRRAGRAALVLTAAGFLIGSETRAALPANDDAGNYNGSGLPNYGNGANAGVGFQPFNLFAFGSAGNFLADFYPSPQSAINTDGKVFDVFAQFGGFAGITRSFTDNSGTGVGTLDIGQSAAFTLDLANTINNGGNVGFTFESNNGQNINFAVNGGDPDNAFGGAYGALTGIRLDTLQGGVAFALTVDSARQFTVTAQGLTDLAAAGSFTFTTNADISLTGLTIYDFDSGPNNDLLFNNLEVTAVPEPATYLAGIGCAALLGFLKLRRRRSQPVGT